MSEEEHQVQHRYLIAFTDKTASNLEKIEKILSKHKEAIEALKELAIMQDTVNKATLRELESLKIRLRKLTPSS